MTVRAPLQQSASLGLSQEPAAASKLHCDLAAPVARGARHHSFEAKRGHAAPGAGEVKVQAQACPDFKRLGQKESSPT